MSKYDRATTVFSPQGQLLQVQYAQEAIVRSSPAVGVKGKGVIVLAVQKKTMEKIQEERTERKIFALDDHVAMAYAGLRADARVLVSRALIECQSYRLTVGEPVTTEHITKYIAGLKQRYTQTNGNRPFGLSCLVSGFDPDGTPHLYQTVPSGEYHEWQAIAIGKCNKSIQEYLERRYNEQQVSTEKGALLLAIRSLMVGGQTGQDVQKNLDITVLQPCQKLKILDRDTIKNLLNEAKTEN